MLQVKVLIQIEGLEPHEEEIAVTSLESAEQEIIKLVGKFNEEEKIHYGKKAQLRKFIKIIHGNTKLIHEWHKVGLTSQEDKHGIYDEWKCHNCNLSRRAYSLGARPLGGECYPERICINCNKEFKTEDNCKRHKEKFHKDLN